LGCWNAGAWITIAALEAAQASAEAQEYEYEDMEEDLD
jgi:hypothetical protein